MTDNFRRFPFDHPVHPLMSDPSPVADRYGRPVTVGDGAGS